MADPSAPVLDPVRSEPRDLMRVLLPAARAAYIRAWEVLADPATPIDARRTMRERASATADDHGVVAAALESREQSLSGDDLLNIRHLRGELVRIAEALVKLAAAARIGLMDIAELRPESLGCGKRYRVPDLTNDQGATATRSVQATTGRERRPKRDESRRVDTKPFADRGPKVDKGALGSSKHDSPLGDDMDAETRAKLEALRAQLEG